MIGPDGTEPSAISDNVTQCKQRALVQIRESFEDCVNPDNRLSYHNQAHTEGVVARTEVITRAMGLSARDVDRSRLAAACHDVSRTWTERMEDDGAVVRVPNSPTDEAQSIVWMISTVMMVFDRNLLLTRHDLSIASAAIMTTAPIARADKDVKYQPLLTASSHPVARALALADMNAAAMARTPEEAEAAAREGDRYLRERELGLARHLRGIKSRAEFPLQLAKIYRRRILDSHDSQTRFLGDRTEHLVGDLGEFEAELAPLLSFDNIWRVRKAWSQLHLDRIGMDFWDLLADIGYDVPAA